MAIGRGLWKEGDVVVIDGIVNGSARFIGWFAGVIRFLNPATSTTTRSP